MTSNKCAVKGCENARGDGHFVEVPVCVPCSHVLYGGEATYGTSMLFTQAREIERLRKIEAVALELIDNGLRNNGQHLVVVERKDCSDPHFRLCGLLKGHQAHMSAVETTAQQENSNG